MGALVRTLRYAVWLTIAAAPIAGRGQTPALDPDVWAKSQALRPQLSMDTRPVPYKVGEFSYLIPRNYIVYFGVTPTIRVTYPDFRPFGPDTAECFIPKPGVPRPCEIVDFTIYGRGLGNRSYLTNYLKLPHRERAGPSGFRIYEIGPPEAFTETCVKENGPFLINTHCSYFQVGTGRSGVCTGFTDLENGAAANVILSLRLIQRLDDIDLKIRDLVRNFTVGGL